nr:putative ribonuclease H-like domain-containing protein [Tanacetum cinerariifolium]
MVLEAMIGAFRLKKNQLTMPLWHSPPQVLLVLIMSLVHDRYKSGEGYHAIPPLYTGTFMRPKPDLVFHDAPTVNETVPTSFNGNPQHALKDKGVIDSGCSRHMIGNMSYLSDFEELNGGYVAFGGNPKGGKIFRKVFFLLTLKLEFKLPDENQVLLRVPRENNIYNVDLKNIVPFGDLTCLFAKATLEESYLWHRRHGYINFKTMNKLVKGNLVRGLPSIFFENDHTCVACKKGKQHRSSYKTKPVSSVNQPLQRLHMDLFRPTFVKSLNKKSYCLVITDDYSRFTWVFFLATKDETGPILKTFIIGLENQLSLKVKIIRSDNGTELKNNDLNQVCGMKGIKREFSVPRTPQQNGITEKKNKTLIKAARSKFDGKVDEGFLVGYSVSSKAFRVFNSRTRIVQKTFHINFLENKPNVEGSGPTWLFDIDTLTKTMNYQPVTAGNQSNPSAVVQEQFDAEKAGEESDHQYVLFPVWSTSSTNPQNTDGDAAFKEKESEFERRKLKSEVNVSPSSSAQSKKHDDKIKTEAKGKSPVESLTGYRNLSAEFEDFSDNSINEDNDAGTLVPAVGVHQALKDPSWIEAMQEELLQFKMQKVWVLVDLPHGKRAIGHTQEEGIDYEEVFALVARIESIRLFLVYASFMGFMVYQMDVKSAFLYENIKEEVYVYQPLGFEGPDYPDKIYKVVKALYGLHQAPRACYETLTNYHLENGFQRGKIDQHCLSKGRKREFSVAGTPQQNGISKRKNRTLIEAARTMLADSLLPSSFWAEAVNTACYVQNRVLVTKPHNKIPYELLLGRIPSIGFMRPFGYPVTILNTLYPLVLTMTCHPPIRPAATCTVPRIQLLAASRRHVAASYWTAASDVAPTSAPVSVGHDGQRRRSTLPDHWSTVVDHRSMAADHNGDRRSMVAVNDGRRWLTTVDCRWTTVDHHQTTCQWWLVGWSGRVKGWV